MGASEDHVLNESFEGKLHLMFDTIASRMIISKGDFLIREGETERNLYLVESDSINNRIFFAAIVKVYLCQVAVFSNGKSFNLAPNITQHSRSCSYAIYA